MTSPKKKTTTTTGRRKNRPSPRQRLLDSATHLFTSEGIRVIGIDRILREADVAKASLYSLFGSKDALVVAYLENVDQEYRGEWMSRAAMATSTDEKILAFFDIAIDTEPQQNYRGSHFLNAANEYPKPESDSEEAIVDACLEHRRWMHETMTTLLTAKNGYPSATQANQLLILLDGGQAGSRLVHNVGPLDTARDLAKMMLSEPPADYSI